MNSTDSKDRPILIGTGFHATLQNVNERANFLVRWLENTRDVSNNIVIVNNSELGQHDIADSFRNTLCIGLRWIKCNRNLGNASTPIGQCAGTPLLGWSMSWIQSALVAYADGCDFVYKEQDCLAFGDWLPAIRKGRFATGRNDHMPCEQSLFYLRHDTILEFVRAYMELPQHDVQMSTEEKFYRVMAGLDGCGFHDLPGGRNRPLPMNAPAWYAQRITPDEMGQIAELSILNVQGWFDFAHIYRRMVDEVRDGGTIIELGVWKGKSLCYLADCARRSGKNIRIIGIDSFKHDQWDGYSTIQRMDREKGELRSVEQQCRDNLARLGLLERVEIVKSDCIEAAKLFADGSVDFLFVDDNHESEHVKRELPAWLPKMRLPTWMAGHDYNGETKAAVDSVFPHAVADGNSWIAKLE